MKLNETHSSKVMKASQGNHQVYHNVIIDIRNIKVKNLQNLKANLKII